MNTKKIVMSLGMIVFVGALIAGGTGAFFSDTETSTGNVFTAGSIDLALGSKTSSTNDANGAEVVYEMLANNNNRALFNFTDLKPGDDGTVVFTLEVTSNDAYICAMSEEMTGDENGRVDPEIDAGDTTPGAGNGELQNYIQLATFADLDNDGVYDQGVEPVNVNQYGGDGNGFTHVEIAAAGWVPVADPSAPNTWLTVGSAVSGTEYGAGMLYCFGDFETTGAGPATEVIGCDGGEMGEFNDAQTDSAIGAITFSAVQTRNNEGFSCADQNASTPDGDVDVNATEVFSTTDKPTAFVEGNWFFYNDTNDTIMTINEFGGSAGENDIQTGPGAVDSAKMVLHDAGARYNIATYQFSATPLSTLSTLKYRVYDASASGETPYLHFNVDFDGTDGWQNRLVMVPTVAAGNEGVPTGVWTEVDAIDAGDAMYCWSKMAACGSGAAATWPTETGVALADNTAQYQKWSDIVAAYPGIKLRTTDSFLGVRVGHPGPAAEEGYVDWVEFDGVKYDFVN